MTWSCFGRSQNLCHCWCCPLDVTPNSRSLHVTFICVTCPNQFGPRTCVIVGVVHLMSLQILGASLLLSIVSPVLISSLRGPVHWLFKRAVLSSLLSFTFVKPQPFGCSLAAEGRLHGQAYSLLCQPNRNQVWKVQYCIILEKDLF